MPDVPSFEVPRTFHKNVPQAEEQDVGPGIESRGGRVAKEGSRGRKLKGSPEHTKSRGVGLRLVRELLVGSGSGGGWC